MRRGAGLLLSALSALALAGAVRAPTEGGSLETDRLGTTLTRLLHGYRWRNAGWSVLVVSLDRGDTIFAENADSLRAPASNMKLLTSAAALEELGPDFRFRTWLVSRGDVRDGVLGGDLVVYGTGDPGISDRFYPSKTTVFEELADQLEARGIHEISGDLVGDASYFPGPLRPEGWDVHDLDDHFAAAVSALSFNENVVSLRVEAARQIGLPPAIHSIPDHAGLDIVNRAVTVSGSGRVFIGRDNPMAPMVVEGRIRRGGRDVWRQITVSDPAAFTLSVFRSVLEARGITVRGGDRVVRLPAASEVGGAHIVAPTLDPAPRTHILATHVSPPLRDYLAVVNKKSNNLFTELIFRTLGRAAGGHASPAASARRVQENLNAMGVDTRGVIQLDGCGLSAGNRVRAATLVSVLSHMAESDLWSEFWATLPEAGNRRELSRMYRTAAAGNLRAKTGTIEGVSALSGMVQSADGERLVFSILVNGTPSTSGAKGIENRIGAQLASFTRGLDAPPLHRVAQLPPPPIPSDSGGPSRHQVQTGESFDGIARRFGVSLQDLLDANPEVEPHRLRAGAWIVIPPTRERAGAGS